MLNEPGYDMDADTLNGFYRRAISSIRQVDPNHIIFLEGSDFGRCFDLLEDPDDPQIAYAFHFYPFVLDEDVLDPAMPEEKRDAFFHQLFDKQIEPCLRFGRPLWCGESGYNIPMDQEPFTTSLILKNIRLCEERGYSWSLWTYKDAGRMGIVYPRLDSPWMTMRRKMEARWTHEYEQASSMKFIRAIGEQYLGPLTDELAYDLDFRVRSILHRIGVEQVLKPTLRSIPWEEMRTYPESFLLENCGRHQQMIDAVSAVLKQSK